jgi:DNA-binding NtrC family response regulator
MSCRTARGYYPIHTGMTQDPSTLEEQAPDSNRSRTAPQALALVIAWCADAPSRAGEIAWLPAGLPGDPRVLGRGGALADDPHPRLMFVRQRPSGPEAVPALSLPTLSRVQLVVSSFGLDHVTVQNVGRCALLVGGKAVDRASLVPGRVAQLGQQLLLLCVRRTVALAAPPDTYPWASFGAPDGLGIVGESPVIWTLRQQLGVVGPRSGHLLLLGQSGSGKELSARGIHALSKRSGRPLVARNAATIPDALIDAELFGNAKNYPNPGMAERPGLVGQADHSTLFLDEVAELPLALQAHLLRVLDHGEYHRLGESVARHSDLRLVAATHRPVSQLRGDLLARFAFRIEVPDLNARREDIPLLVPHLLRRLAETDGPLAPGPEPPKFPQAPEISIGLCRQLLEHAYTSHLRELERLLLQAFVEGGGADIKSVPALRQSASAAEHEASMAPDGASSRPTPSGVHPPPLTPQQIQAVLDAHNGSIETAYRALGLRNRFALGRLIAKHRLEVRRTRSQRPGRRSSGNEKG